MNLARQDRGDRASLVSRGDPTTVPVLMAAPVLFFASVLVADCGRRLHPSTRLALGESPTQTQAAWPDWPSQQLRAIRKEPVKKSDSSFLVKRSTQGLLKIARARLRGASGPTRCSLTNSSSVAGGP